VSLPMIVLSIAVVFLVGVIIGVGAAVSVAVRREDRSLSLGREPPGLVSRGVRRLTGVGIADDEDWERNLRWGQTKIRRGSTG
jgi:hypothetical protein